MGSSNKVVLNTIILYTRMVFTMGITLYTTRIVLGALGTVDYGIFNLLSGVILMLSFLNAALATSTQRYLSYYQGMSDVEMQRKVFSASLSIHILVAIIMVVGLELAGFFLFDGFLNIPETRIYQAKVIYHFMSATVFFTVIAVPFNGFLFAHENMIWVAVVTVFETLLKLGIAISLYWIATDKLVFYGLTTSAISVVSFMLYAVYCLLKYKDCSLRGLGFKNKKLIREIGSFAGWNLFGSLCSLGRSQGLAIIMNIFLGAVINAAYGIANQIASQLSFFSITILRALDPQIMKSEGANNRDRMLRLSMIASKFGFFLLAIFALPCIYEMPSILKFWLKEVPPHTIIFCNLVLIGMMVNQLTVGLQSALQATGQIKLYQIGVGTLLLLNLPIAYLLLYFKYPVHYILISYIGIELLGCVFRIYLSKIIAGLSIKEYLNRVILCEIFPVMISAGLCVIVLNSMNFRYRFLFTGIISGLGFLISAYFFGLKKDEKEIINNMLKKILQKVKPNALA